MRGICGELRVRSTSAENALVIPDPGKNVLVPATIKKLISGVVMVVTG